MERTIRRVDAFQQRHLPTAFLFGVTKKYGDDNGGVLTSNLAFSAFTSVFPLLLVLITVLGLVMAGDPAARRAIEASAFADFPLIGHELGKNVHSLRKASIIGLVIGLLTLLWGASGLAQSGLFAMSEVWNLPGPERPNFVKRLGRSAGFLAVMAVGVVVTSALASFGTFGRHNIGLGILAEVLALVVNVGQYLLAFRALTPKKVHTRQLWPGAIVGGIGWTILQAVGGYLVGHDLRNAGDLYGSFGVVLGLVAWIYLGVELTVYAAEVNAVLAYHLWPRGMVQPPLTSADQRSLGLQTFQNQRRPEQNVEVTYSEPPSTQDEYLRQEK